VSRLRHQTVRDLLVMSYGDLMESKLYDCKTWRTSERRNFSNIALQGLILSILKTSTDARSNYSFSKDSGVSQSVVSGLSFPHVVGSAIVLRSGIFGALLWLHRHSRENNSRNEFILGVAAVPPLIVTLSGPAFEIRNLLPVPLVCFRIFSFANFSSLRLCKHL